MQRRPIHGLAVVAALVALAAVAHAATPDECGDADASGSRTVTDGVLVLRTAAELSDGCQVSSRCDVDGNGAVTVSDGVAALRLAAGLDAPLACRNVVVDLSSFTVFSFARHPAFGFCPPLDSVSAMVLSRVDGRLEMTGGKAIVAGAVGDPDCLSDVTTVPPVACAREIDLPARTLTADESARVTTAFTAVTREQQSAPDCARVTFEPCLLDYFSWNTSLITDFVCGEPRLVSDQSAALIAVLDSLQ